MIVIAIIAIIAAIAIPNLLAARLNAHETAAISTLRNIGTAQSQIQTGGRIDVDLDGTGEFGFFRELSGAYGTRVDAGGTVTVGALTPASLSGSFRVISAAGTVNRSGYLFKMYLPGDSGVGVEEAPTGPLLGDVFSDSAEVTWCAYAWPVTHDNSGSRTFFVNQSGNMCYTDDKLYSGSGFVAATGPGAAFQGVGGSISKMTGLIAIGTVGRDGNVWRQVN
jgi:type II secretory pathway pseudopilin PulG